MTDEEKIARDLACFGVAYWREVDGRKEHIPITDVVDVPELDANGLVKPDSTPKD